MGKKYGNYTDEDLNDWQMFPENKRVLTSNGFGAWLLRRDERKGNRDLITELEKIKAEMLGQKMFYTPDIEIIDKHIKELKGE